MSPASLGSLPLRSDSAAAGRVRGRAVRGNGRHPAESADPPVHQGRAESGCTGKQSPPERKQRSAPGGAALDQTANVLTAELPPRRRQSLTLMQFTPKIAEPNRGLAWRGENDHPCRAVPCWAGPCRADPCRGRAMAESSLPVCHRCAAVSRQLAVPRGSRAGPDRPRAAH